MRTPRLLIAAVVVATGLAGCLGSTPTDVAEPGPADTANASDRIVRFGPDGTELPIPNATGVADFILTGHPSDEPNIGIDSDGNIFASGDEGRVVRSTDGGQSWEQVWELVPEDDGVGTEHGVIQSFDPMLWLDPTTERIFADPMWPALACTWMAWSDDAGDSWTERPGACHPPVMDHQKLVSGPPGPDAPPVAGQAYPTVVYRCYNQLTDTMCAVSYDGGVDWVVHQVAADVVRDGCGGINGHPAVRSDGVVALPITSCDQPGLAVSHDSGLTWSFTTVPADGVTSLDAEVTFGQNGTMFYQYRGPDHRQKLAWSTDLGETWDGPVDVTPPDVGSTTFHALAAGDDGRVAMAFLGTAAEGVPDHVDEDAYWHLYIVTSRNATAEDPTFVGRQVTPDDDPVQVGSICIDDSCHDGNRNLLDFIDGALAPDGTFHVIYTEGCVDECANMSDPGPQDSRSFELAMGVLEDWSLLEEPAEGVVPT